MKRSGSGDIGYGCRRSGDGKITKLIKIYELIIENVRSYTHEVSPD